MEIVEIMLDMLFGLDTFPTIIDTPQYPVDSDGFRADRQLILAYGAAKVYILKETGGSASTDRSTESTIVKAA